MMLPVSREDHRAGIDIGEQAFSLRDHGRPLAELHESGVDVIARGIEAGACRNRLLKPLLGTVKAMDLDADVLLDREIETRAHCHGAPDRDTPTLEDRHAE